MASNKPEGNIKNEGLSRIYFLLMADAYSLNFVMTVQVKVYSECQVAQRIVAIAKAK